MKRLRDWVYDNYHWAYLAGTGVLCQSLFFPSRKLTLAAWAGCAALGVVLEPCVNPYRQVYGRSLWRLSEEHQQVALTFDDGPDQDTPALLDLLAELKVQANFFCIGQQIERHPEVVRRILAEGHLLGNHTYSHPNLMTCSPSRTRQELQRVQDLVLELTGETPRFWRPPFGFRAPWTMPMASQLGLESVLWSINPRDFHDPGSDVICQRCLEPLAAGAILLLHDGIGPRPQTLQAVAQLVPQLRERGYALVRLDQARG